MNVKLDKDPFKPVVKVKVVNEAAREFGLPYHRKEGDAGADLYVVLSEEDRKDGLTIFPGERKLLDTGLRIELPDGVYARITHRSSTEKRHRLRVVEGTIDQGYRGKLFAQVSNDNTFPVTIKHGDRIAQLILLPLIQANFIEVDELADSDRGEGGFGSTGKNGK